MLSYYDFDHSTEEQTPEQTRLYETCLKGSREEIRNYCQNGNIDRQYLKGGLNPMHVVAVAGRADAEAVLDIMLQNGVDVNVKTTSGEDTVLHLIVEHVSVKDAFPLVLKMLEYRPDLKIRNRKLRTPYDIALARGEYELAEVLDGHMTPEQAREFYLKGIGVLYGAKLIEAVLKSNEDDIAEFLKLGADPNYVNEHKNGAIHYAITHCKLPPERPLFLLTQGGADVNLQDDEGDTALNLVIKSARLRETGEMYKCAELLLNNNALSTFKDLDGNDALTLAKKKHYDDIVQLLSGTRTQHVQRPNLPELPDDRDDFDHPVPGFQNIEEEEDEEPPQTFQTQPSPRPTPRFVPPPAIQEFLDENDDDTPHPPPNRAITERPIPQYIMNDILTPRDLSSRGLTRDPQPTHSTTLKKQMLSPQLPNDVSEDNDENHLIRATREGTVNDVKEALNSLDADPNMADETGIYPIHHVCIRGEFVNEDERIEMLRALIDAGADINMPTVNSESSAMHIAATNNQDHVAKALLDTHKCDYNAKNKLGRTAYEVAEEEECQEVMDVIDNHRKQVRDRMKKAAKASTCNIL